MGRKTSAVMIEKDNNTERRRGRKGYMTAGITFEKGCIFKRAD